MKYLLFLLFFKVCFALDIPRLSSPVIDLAGMLQSKSQIISLIRSYREKTGVQIQVLTIPSLMDESLEGYSLKVVESWKLGGEKNDGGLLFLIAKNERKMRLEVGYGLEGFLTDLEAGEIIAGVKSYFKVGKFDTGVLFALHETSKKIGEEPFLDKELQKGRELDITTMIIFFIFICMMISHISRYSRRKSRGSNYSSRRGRWGNDDDFFGGGGFGGSSGGGWSGGGGSFGGGGASGGW